MSITELIAFAIGCTLTALGSTAIVASALRRRAAERRLLVFGMWCVFYGLRLAALQPPVRASVGGTIRAWTYFIAFITYSINVPTALFFEALIGAGWKQSVQRVRQVQVVYAAAAIAASIVTSRPGIAMPLNNPLVLIGLAIQVANVWLFRARLGRLFTTSAITIGAGALVLGVINENLGRPILPAVSLEPIGVLIFIVTLAYGVVGSVVRGEAELLSVQRELATAREIQRSLLPQQTPQVPGVEVAAQFVPMTAVGGDLYDFVDFGPAGIGVLIADVSGHGIPAALVASMVKLAFSGQAEQARDPARVLGAMNRALSRQLGSGFVTALYAFIDAERGVMTVANAGHPPLLIGRADASVVEIHEHGIVLGFLPDAVYNNSEIELREGDVILVYTDGVLEAQNAAGEFFDRERVRSWLTSAARDGVKKFAEMALADLERWSGSGSFPDDVTFVVAQFTGRDSGMVEPSRCAWSTRTTVGR